MKDLTKCGLIVCFFLLTVCTARAGWNEASIEKTITGAAEAMTDLPRTKDLGAVLRFYSEDYTGINDGEWETMEEMKNSFSDLIGQMNLGRTMGISYRVSNITAHATGSTGWATYDFSVRIGVSDEVLAEESGKCTGIYIKKDGAWLTLHEHCSSIADGGTEETQNPQETI